MSLRRPRVSIERSSGSLSDGHGSAANSPVRSPSVRQARKKNRSTSVVSQISPVRPEARKHLRLEAARPSPLSLPRPEPVLAVVPSTPHAARTIAGAKSGVFAYPPIVYGTTPVTWSRSATSPVQAGRCTSPTAHSPLSERGALTPRPSIEKVARLMGTSPEELLEEEAVRSRAQSLRANMQSAKIRELMGSPDDVVKRHKQQKLLSPVSQLFSKKGIAHPPGRLATATPTPQAAFASAPKAVTVHRSFAELSDESSDEYSDEKKSEIRDSEAPSQKVKALHLRREEVLRVKRTAPPHLKLANRPEESARVMALSADLGHEEMVRLAAGRLSAKSRVGFQTDVGPLLGDDMGNVKSELSRIGEESVCIRYSISDDAASEQIAESSDEDHQ